jgi:hypothetical protein
MAYVRTTQTLLSDLHSRVMRMMEAKIEQVTKYGFTSHNEDKLLEAIAKQQWHKAPELRGKLPEEWCRRSDSRVNVKVKLSDDIGSVVVHHKVFDEDKRPWLPPVGTNYHFDVDRQHFDSEGLEVLKAIKQSDVTKEEIREQFSKLSRDLREYLGAHTSLNQALKDMPELALYIPQKYIDKVEAATPKKQSTRKKVEAPNIDRQAIAAQAIAHRISGGV